MQLSDQIPRQFLGLLKGRRGLMAAGLGALALASVSPSALAAPSEDDVGFFSKQRVLERLGRTLPDVTVDQREGGREATVRVGADIERLSRAVAKPDDDPISPAEVEGALDAAYAPLVPVLDIPNAAAPETATHEAPAAPDRCSAIGAARPTSWGLMGALDGATFTWVDGVGKLRTVKYRLAADGGSISLSISVGGKLVRVDTYRQSDPNRARVETSDGGAAGEIVLGPDRFSYVANHELGSFTLDSACNLVVSGSLRQTSRQIEDIFFNTSNGADADQERAIRSRSAVRIARLRKSAVIGLARHS